jgi:hypothetical protein
MTFAPGPYSTVEVGCGASFHAYITDKNGRKIGVAWGPLAEKVWTAALFAAAPDLLAALKNIVCMASNESKLSDDDWNTVIDEAATVIAKLEGITALPATEREK